MNNIAIEENFKNYYLTCGQTYDNFIFEQCPIEFMDVAQMLLSKSENNVKPCNIKICRKQQSELENVFLNCGNDYQKNALARYYITILIMVEFFKDIDNKVFKSLKEQIECFINNDFEKIKQNYIVGYMPYDVARISKKAGQKIELNIFLIDIDNKDLQQAINNFISSREPYSIKLFTNNQLTTHYDQNGNLIQCPHDYMTRNISKFVTTEKDYEQEM